VGSALRSRTSPGRRSNSAPEIASSIRRHLAGMGRPHTTQLDLPGDGLLLVREVRSKIVRSNVSTNGRARGVT